VAALARAVAVAERAGGPLSYVGAVEAAAAAVQAGGSERAHTMVASHIAEEPGGALQVRTGTSAGALCVQGAPAAGTSAGPSAGIAAPLLARGAAAKWLAAVVKSVDHFQLRHAVLTGFGEWPRGEFWRRFEAQTLRLYRALKPPEWPAEVKGPAKARPSCTRVPLGDTRADIRAFVATDEAQQTFRGFANVYEARAEAARATGNALGANSKHTTQEKWVSKDGALVARGFGAGCHAKVEVVKVDAPYYEACKVFAQREQELRELEEVV
jgi:hypothetical protein